MGEGKTKSNPLNEALRRIEQAKLYEALLNHELFAEDSASPDIVEAVRAEISEFIQTRLEVLLGIRQESTQVEYQSDFDEAEVVALKALAARALSGPSKSSQPTQPTIIPVAAPAKANKRGKSRRQEEVVAPAVAPRPKSGNVSQMAIERPDGTKEIVEADYSQAVNPATPPMRMPSQLEIDTMHARQAAENMRGATMAAPVMGNIVTNVLSAAQRNPNIKEE